MLDGFLTTLPFVLAYWVGYLHARFLMRQQIKSILEALSKFEKELRKMDGRLLRALLKVGK